MVAGSALGYCSFQFLLLFFSLSRSSLCAVRSFVSFPSSCSATFSDTLLVLSAPSPSLRSLTCRRVQQLAVSSTQQFLEKGLSSSFSFQKKKKKNCRLQSYQNRIILICFPCVLGGLSITIFKIVNFNQSIKQSN